MVFRPDQEPVLAWPLIGKLRSCGARGRQVGRHRRNHIQFDSCAGSAKVVDTDKRSGRHPIAKVLYQDFIHCIHLAHIRQIFRQLDDVTPGQPLAVENDLDIGERPARLFADVVGKHVLFRHVRMLVIERRRRHPDDAVSRRRQWGT